MSVRVQHQCCWFLVPHSSADAWQMTKCWQCVCMGWGGWAGGSARVCVHPHICMYVNTVGREGGDSAVKRAERLLLSFLLEFHSILKENIFSLFCMTPLCLSAYFTISLSVYLYIYKSISTLLSDRWYLYLHYLLVVLQICSVSLMVNCINPS